MYKIHLITYATHSEGLLDNLINNKFNKKNRYCRMEY